MTPHDLIAAFEDLADAPDGVKRLRALVLHLAVRGKLVPQDPRDTGVSASGSPPSKGEVPFALPEKWAWLRLPDVAEYTVGKTPATKEPRFWGRSEIPWVSIGDMPDGGVVSTTSRTVTTEAASEVFRRPPVPAGTLLMSFKLTIGKIAVLGVDAYHNEAIISVTPNRSVDRNYLFRVLPMMALGGESKDAIMGATLNGQSLARILVPLPPLAEQHRIVARVDELMGLLDRLEAARTARDDLRRAARDSALAALRDAEDTEAVEAAWGRIAGQMDTMFSDPEDVGPLRQAVLGLAVRGRLVPQDPKDEPATLLLKTMAADAERLARAKVIRRPAPLSAVGDAEKLFMLPKGWEWSRLQDVGDWGAGATPLRADSRYFGGTVNWFKSGELPDGPMSVPSEERITEAALAECSLRKNQPGDVLMAMYGATIGKLGLLEVPGTTNQAVCACTCFKGFYNRYLFLLLMAWREAFKGSGEGGAQPNISKVKIVGTAIPVPPLAEQHRIVAKVDALMAQCDDLEARLTTARDLHGKFAAAAVHHLDV